MNCFRNVIGIFKSGVMAKSQFTKNNTPSTPSVLITDLNLPLFPEAQCVYSDWMTVSDCSVTCGSGYKTEVRSFLKVKDKTPGSKDCKEDLERYTKCELDSC